MSCQPERIQQTWHTQDSQGQFLALAFRLFPLGSETVLVLEWGD